MNKHKKRGPAYRLAVLFLLTWAGYTSASAEMATDLLTQVVMPAGADYIVMDVLDGVEARYRTMDYYDVYGAYSCAGYVKAYYAAVYGVQVQNLMDKGPPHPADMFTQVTTPQKGDLIFYPSPPNKNNHSAIVKDFNGTRITLIEQDYKWAQSGGTYTYINRTIPYPPEEKAPYEIWRLVFVPGEAAEETTPVFVQQPNEPHSDTVLAETPPEDTPDQPVEVEEEPIFSYEAVVTIGRMAITVNGMDMPIDACAMIENNRTIMPVRWVGYALGLNTEDLYWDALNRTVMILHRGDVILFAIDSNLLYINNQPVQMDCSASLQSGRAYLPVKYLAEALGVSFIWNPETASATFYK